MKQKKKEFKQRTIWMLVALIVMIGVYYWIAPEDFTKQVKTLYTSLTEVVETTEESDTMVSGDLEIYFFDVGQADAILVTCDGENMIIDAGNNADGKLLVNQLNEMGIQKIHYLIGTHPHEDHIGGMDNLIKYFKIGKIYMPNRQADSMTFEDVINAVSEKKLKITTPKKGTTFSLGNAKCQILSAQSDAEDTNDVSIVIEMTYGMHKYLFTGDLTSTLEAEIDWEDIDVLKVAHHGSRYSSSQAFLEATKPEIAVISCGKENDYGHPHKEALNRLKKAKCEIYRTDKSGTIHLMSNGKKTAVEFLEIHLDGNGGE